MVGRKGEPSGEGAHRHDGAQGETSKEGAPTLLGTRVGHQESGAQT